MPGSEDAASFERTLNTLTGKINRATARNDNQKQLSRRARVMWTLYAGFAYILAAVMLTLVTGWRNWGPIEGSIVAGGPVLIYGLRYALMSYFDYRIRNTELYLKKLNKERDATIERLKEATKYNSTQQLLEKYGASPKPKEQPQGDSPGHKKPQGPQKSAPAPGPRTGVPPPPTANIQRPQTHPRPTTPQRAPTNASAQQGLAPPGLAPPVRFPSDESPAAEFAPNAFGTDLTKQYSATEPVTFTESHWYDRILDALLGEDETQAKNRFALICSECRLVNGQAPPGARTLEDVGRWRCGGCSAWNGKEKPREDDITRLVQGWEAERKAKDVVRELSADGGIDSDNRETEDDSGAVAADESSGVNDAAQSEEDTPPPSRNTRSKSKGRAKK
ncbi:lunapark [Pyrenophora seminiperda CCB06]|uniref:Endoplasmic reticulum junction formation protein lunapark n=1 Tax=Pyrenophora seminiperda CCB06 TaxID=1302712 RepID=A0A3M7MAM7_9PLEO|nr:lunapark [Pyrenophora seminiperda CCB06]